MLRIEFQERAVAYVDILGFKNLVNSAIADREKLAKLEELVALLRGAVPSFDAMVSHSVDRTLIPKHLYISDCIILSAPLEHSSRADYNGLGILVLRVIQLSHFFLNAGYLLSGGISVGKVWHIDGNVIGPAYQEAYDAQTKVKEPVVVLTDSASAKWKRGSRECIRKSDGQLFVNGLFEYYMPNATEPGVIDNTYRLYREIADSALSSDISFSAKEKWGWFKKYLAAEMPDGKKWPEA